MYRSKVEIYLHIVWATRGREPLLTANNEQAVQGVIVAEAVRLGCRVLAIGGTADHVHLAVALPATVTVAALVQQFKGVSSRTGAELSDALHGFGWQEGYAAFSISRPHVAKVMAYVERQKEHHADGSLWAQWEPEYMPSTRSR